MMHRWLIALCLLVFPVAAHAAAPSADAPITYAKERVILKPRTPNTESPTAQANALFYVDVRPASGAPNPDWFQLSGFKPNTGLLLTYQKPEMVTIEPANIYAHYDIIAANPYGEIVLILPDIELASLTQAIQTPEPVAALLYVAAGTAKAIGLTIGDHIEHRMFAKRPNIIDAVTKPEASEQQTNINIAPKIIPSVEQTIEEETGGRRRPMANPVVPEPSVAEPKPPAKPEAPKTPSVPQTNSNLLEQPAGQPQAPDQSVQATDFLNTILKRDY